ncbi:MAG: hypothetical protein K9J13_02195 [Saprospiraceae bacterium]|nr:hypothetical protein [Saprospiraceae bacterium]
MLKIKYKLIILAIIIITVSSFKIFQSSRISISMESKTLIKGKSLTLIADVYYDNSNSIMVTHYTKPNDYYFITNSKGEAKIYDPVKNEVMLDQGIQYNTQQTLFYYFLSNQIYDLGLKDLGFKITDTKFKDGMQITTWFSPPALAEKVSRVELVHEDYLPIFLGYYDKNGKLAKKIYYYNYSTNSDIKFPLKVVEFNYFVNGDSIVNRIAYSNLKMANQSTNKYFDIKIPENAKIVNKGL